MITRHGWLLLVGLLLPLAAAGETYKCRLPDGKITYSNQRSMIKGAKCDEMFVKKPPIVTQGDDMAMDMPQAPAAVPAPAPGQAPGATPPPGQAPQPVPGQPPQGKTPENAKGAPPIQRSPEDMELEAKRKKQDAEDARKAVEKANENKLAQQKVKDENCQKAKTNLQTYQIGGRISKINENGEKVYMDDNEVNRKIDEARQEVSRWCEGG